MRRPQDDHARKLCLHAAQRDQQLALLRHIWDHIDPARRSRLRASLLRLEKLQFELLYYAHGFLALPNVCTSRDMAREIHDQVSDPRDRAILKEIASGPEASIGPAELVCCLDCWALGEDYVPCEGNVEDHPRWPAESKRTRRNYVKFLDQGAR